MSRTRDWHVITGWEKRIAVDFGSIGPSHVRWSDWTYKERDIVARKVHEITNINELHGNRSKRAEEWQKENAPIMVGFARDQKPMPDWAHADYRQSGVPEYVKVVWQREDPNDLTSPADWAYDPPAPWTDKGEEPAWSAVPAEEPKEKPDDYSGNMHAKFGGVISYRTAANGDHIATDGTVISTAESRAKEDIPQWKKFEVGRLEDVDGHIVPGPNALPKDVEQYGENVKLTNLHKTRPQQAAPVAAVAAPPVVKPKRIMPDDPNFTAVEKALNWAAETHHGPAHQERWNGVAAALGADNGATPMNAAEVERLWKHFRKNARWSMAKEALEDLAPTEVDAPSLLEAVVQAVEDSATCKDGAEYRLTPMGEYGTTPPPPGSTGWYTRKIEWLPKWYWDLPAITHEEAEAQKVNSRANVAPRNYIYYKNGVGIVGRLQPSEERTDLPVWTAEEAQLYYKRKGIRMRSVIWLDGHLMTRKGYSDNGNHTGLPIARAADEAYEASHVVVKVPKDLEAALKAEDWAEVARLAQERAGN